eukprot:tig00021616_g22916.t1
MAKPVIVVLGATGQQGGAAAKHLVKKGNFEVHAVVRDPTSDKAKKLEAQGVKLVKGDQNDVESLKRAFDGAAGVFSVQAMIENGKYSAEREIQQGKNVADACKAAGVKHLVYTSVASANRSTGVPHFDSKYAIEQHIKQLGVPATILRPAYFMDNMVPGGVVGAKPGVANGLTTPSTRIQMVAVDDIGGFAAMCFAEPKAWIGKEVDLAGDEVNGPELAQTFERVCGYPFKYSYPPLFILRFFAHEIYLMTDWFQRVGYSVNIAEVRKAYPMKTVEQWLRENDMAAKLPRPEPRSPFVTAAAVAALAGLAAGAAAAWQRGLSRR